MNRKIIVKHSEVGRIAQLMGCSRKWVARSLEYGIDTELARRIRRMALLRGGKEMVTVTAEDNITEEAAV